MSVDIRHAQIDGLENVHARLALPARVSAPTFFLIPGGAMTHRYFDLPVPSYSLAEMLVASGSPVVLFDLPGTGVNAGRTDPWSITPHNVARVVDTLSRQLRAALREHSAPASVVALGHSMGAFCALWTQAAHDSFDALALLGWSHVGLPEQVEPSLLPILKALTTGGFGAAIAPEWLAAAARRSEEFQGRSRSDLPQDRRPPTERSSPALLGALKQARTRLLPTVAFASFAPGLGTAAAAEIRVPVALCTGDRDLARDATATPAVFIRTRVKHTVLANTGHDQVVSPQRERLASVLAGWAAEHVAR